MVKKKVTLVSKVVANKYVNVRPMSLEKIHEEFDKPNGLLHGIRRDTIELSSKFYIGERKEKTEVMETLFQINENNCTIDVLTFRYKHGRTVRPDL